MTFKAQDWWATAIGPVFLVLFLATLVLPTVSRKTGTTVVAIGSLVASFGVIFIAAFMFGPQRGIWVAAGLLLAVLIGSMVMMRLPFWFNAGRVLLVIGAMAMGLTNAQPWNRETSDLLRIAIYVQRFPEHTERARWLHDELLSRGETRGLLEQKLGDANAVGLHRELGFPAAARQAACHALHERERKEACPGE
ncbi:MAG: hypothetical protein ACO1OB_17455 [Archangium sp.]